MDKQYNKIGLFGGTFDPVHLGHLKAAAEILKTLGLDHIYFIPARTSPFKKVSPLVSPEHRLEILRRTVVGQEAFSISEYELSRDAVSYSIDTIRHYKNILSSGVGLYWILGSDSFMDIEKWKDVQEIFSNCHVVVVSRPGYKLHPLQTVLKDPKLLKEFVTLEGGELYQHFTGHQIRLVQLPLIDISSTILRKKIANGQPYSEFVPKSVEEYIRDHKLYRGKSA